MKITLLDRPKLIALSLLAFSIGSNAFAQPDLSAVSSQEASEVIATLRFPPPATFTADVMAAARIIQPGPQTEMLPMMFLGALGYPEFPGISGEKNLSLFILDDGQSASKPGDALVMLIKMTADSPVRPALAGYGFQFKDFSDDWVLLARSADVLARFDTIDRMIEQAQAEKVFYVELHIDLNSGKIEDWMVKLKDALLMSPVFMDAEDEDSAEKSALVEGSVQFVKACLVNFDWVKFGMDIDGEAIGYNLLAQAIAGTPEAKLFASNAGGSVPVARWLPADATVIYSANSDVAAWLDYWKVLEQRLRAHVEHPAVTSYLAMMDESLKFMDSASGSFAARLNYTDLANGVIDFEYIMEGDLQEAEILALYQTLYEQYIPELIEGFADLPYGELFNYTVNANYAVHRQVNIHQIAFAGNTEQAAPDAVETVASFNFNTYFSIVDGNLLLASSEQSLTALIDGVLAGSPVPENIGEAITLQPGQAIVSHLNLVEYMAELFGPIAGPFLDTPGVADELERLRELKLPPMVSNFSHADAQMSMGMSVPVASIAVVVDFFKKANEISKAAESASEAETEAETEAEGEVYNDPFQ